MRKPKKFSFKDYGGFTAATDASHGVRMAYIEIHGHRRWCTLKDVKRLQTWLGNAAKYLEQKRK